MPLSSDPDGRKASLGNLLRGQSDDETARQKQLANLTPAPPPPPAGNTRALQHGLRSRRPPALLLDPIAQEIEAQLAEDLPLKDKAGGVPAPDRFAVELAAIALVRVRRCAAFLQLHGDADESGSLRPEFEAFGKAVEQAAKMLDRLGCSPRARAALGVDLGRMQALDLAAEMAADAEAEQLEQGGDGDG